MTDGERLHTLTEASKILAAQRCTVEGHDVLWIPTRYDGDTPNMPSPLYGCTRCPQRCLVVYPLDHIPPLSMETGFTAARRKALRKQCIVPPLGRYFPTGHDLIHLDREEWVCTRCDALITFQEKW